MTMDIYNVLTIMLVTAGCSIFLGHAAGYHSGRKAGLKVGIRQAENDE